MSVKVLRRPALFTRIKALPNHVRAGIAVRGKAARYAQVWEWGTLRFKQPGPKTQWGSNPDGDGMRIFTKTAPSGYVRMHKVQFYDMVKLAVTSISVQSSLSDGSYQQKLTDNINKAATEIAQIMAKDAPIDTGLLRASIQAVGTSDVDTLLQAAFRPLLIGGFSDDPAG